LSLVGKLRRIPHYLSAGSPKGLQRKMLLNNTKDGVEYRYFDIQKDGKNWIAWFLREVIPSEMVETKKDE
jgi:hypothetical protein